MSFPGRYRIKHYFQNLRKAISVVGKIQSAIFGKIEDYGMTMELSSHPGKEPVSHTNKFGLYILQDEEALKIFRVKSDMMRFTVRFKKMLLGDECRQ